MGFVADAFATFIGGAAGSEAAATAIASEAAGAGLGLGAATGGVTAFEAGAAAGGLLGSQVVQTAAGAAVTSALTPKPDIPKVKEPASMPDPLETRAARRKAITDQLSRRGRASTILTNMNDKLG